MTPEDEVAAKFLTKLLEAGGWQGLMVASLTAAWFWFKGKNVHPEWATKGALDDLDDKVGRMDNKMDRVDDKVDRVDDKVDDVREALARIEGFLEGRER